MLRIEGIESRLGGWRVACIGTCGTRLRIGRSMFGLVGYVEESVFLRGIVWGMWKM